MNSQEIIERDLRMVIGDLQVQLIITRAQLTEMKEHLEQQMAAPSQPNIMDEMMPKPNGMNGSEHPRRPGGPRNMRPMAPVAPGGFPGEFDESTSRTPRA